MITLILPPIEMIRQIKCNEGFILLQNITGIFMRVLKLDTTLSILEFKYNHDYLSILAYAAAVVTIFVN